MYKFCDIITKNLEMLENIEKARRYINKNIPVMIYGETGTGKELFAQAIHYEGKRSKCPFVAQNCANLAEGVFESMLWGVEKGAFTGAVEHPGLFEAANGGTLFLDEINSLGDHLQSKLLRVVENYKILRVGASRTKDVDIRLVTAMNDTPENTLKTGTIRKDLFFRLSAASLKMVPLRERKEDIDLYVKHYIETYNREYETQIKGISDELEEMLYIYTWPGNVRELKHYITAACTMAENPVIMLNDMPSYFFDLAKGDNKKNEWVQEVLEKDLEEKDFTTLVREFEEQLIDKAMKKCGGNISKTSKMLKIPRQTLQYKLEKQKK